MSMRPEQLATRLEAEKGASDEIIDDLLQDAADAIRSQAAELAEADAAFEELAIAARRLLRDLAHADPGGYLPQMAEELAGLVWPDTPETAHAAGEED